MISRLFLRAGIVFALVGMGLGIVMGAQHDFTLAPVHAHINLIGFVTMVLAGLFYRTHPEIDGRFAGFHFGTALAGLMLIAPGIAGSVLNKPWGEPLAIGGAIVTFTAMVMFAVQVFRATRVAELDAVDARVARA